MRNALPPRIFAAIVATIVTLSLFDLVATMGQSPNSTAAVPAAPVAFITHAAVA